MSISHHLDHATLMRFSAGELDEAFSVVAAAHLSMCRQCRTQLKLAGEVGGALLEEMQPHPLAAEGLDATLARLDLEYVEPQKVVAKRAPRQNEGEAVPVPLQPYVGKDWKKARWRTIAPGVAKCTLALSAGAQGSLFLLRINPGLKMPEHGHGGDEMTLILDGAYRDKFGTFGAGDVADLDEHDEHVPTVVSDVACICLVATERPTRFKGVVSRILQPFFGI